MSKEKNKEDVELENEEVKSELEKCNDYTTDKTVCKK